MPNINIDDTYILGETGAQVDKVTGLFTKDEGTTSGEKAFAQLNIGTAGSNRNLLDNPWFTVNQRGFASNAGTNNVRGVDRWLINSGGGTGGATTLNADGTMTLTAGASYQSFQQTIEIVPSVLVGKTMTISVLLQDGTIESKSFVVPAQTSSLQEIGRLSSVKYRVFVYLSATGTNTIIPQIQVYAGNTITVRAIKLELGSVSTLANDAPPEYAEELMKCNFYDIMLKTSAAYGYLGYGIADSATSATILIPLPNNMRDATPTITTSGTVAVKGGTSGTHTMTGITFKLRVTGGVLVTVTTTGLTTGEFCLLQLNSASSYINLSADL